MARTIAQIQQSIIDAKNANATLSGLSSASNVAIWKLWTYVVAVCQWVMENLFDLHKSEVEQILAAQRPHTLKWYVTKARAFQYGVTLPPDADVYEIDPPGDPSVLLVASAAAVELGNMVRMKVAKSDGVALEQLSGSELSSFNGYMQRIKDAGVRVQCTSGPADNLQLAISIFYDPLILDEDGKRLDGASNTPVKDAINAFLADMTFNGLFVLNRLITAIEAVEGVRICDVQTAQANYAATPYVMIDYEYIPDAGYMKLDEAFFTASYFAHGPI